MQATTGLANDATVFRASFFQPKSSLLEAELDAAEKEEEQEEEDEVHILCTMIIVLFGSVASPYVVCVGTLWVTAGNECCIYQTRVTYPWVARHTSDNTCGPMTPHGSLLTNRYTLDPFIIQSSRYLAHFSIVGWGLLIDSTP